jgi:type III secretion protein Q
VWLSHSLPSIEGIDWNSVDQPVLYSLIVAHPLDFDLVSQHAPLIRISAAELVSDTSTLATLPRLATSTGTILVAQFTYGNALECPRGAANIENKLVTDLDFVVGASKFPIASLPAIEVGDVLVIEHVTEQISCNGKILFNYTLMQESIMITNPNDNEVQYDAQTDRDQLVGIDALPIDLSFVLMKKSVTFAELKAMAPGEMVELPATQVMNIEIRANQRSFGRGELVQLTNGQLAVEIRQILS